VKPAVNHLGAGLLCRHRQHACWRLPEVVKVKRQEVISQHTHEGMVLRQEL